ncbi:2109_t:CDS:2, partial [Racocetra fulgida]
TDATNQKIKELEEKLAMLQTSKEAPLYFQYYTDSQVHCVSSGAWEDFIQLHDHLKKCFNIEGLLKDYEFIIGDEKMNFGWTKSQFIDFLKQQKCSIDNPVRISDVKK